MLSPEWFRIAVPLYTVGYATLVCVTTKHNRQ